MNILQRIKYYLFIKLRILKYNLLSDCKRVDRKPDLHFPLLLKGKGSIRFGQNFQNGVVLAHHYYSGYNYILAVNDDSRVEIGNNVVMANGASIQAVSTVTVGDHSMIGINCFLIDTDGHDLHPDRRMDGDIKTAPITIGKNVVIFYESIIMKGVTIGDNSIIGARSIVTSDIPPNVFAAGSPARVIRSLI